MKERKERKTGRKERRTEKDENRSKRVNGLVAVS